MSYVPSRKWFAATVVALGALGTAWAQAGEWSSTLSVMAIGIAVSRLTAYWLPNSGDSESGFAGTAVLAVLLGAVLIGLVAWALPSLLGGMLIGAYGMVVALTWSRRQKQTTVHRGPVERERIGW